MFLILQTFGGVFHWYNYFNIFHSAGIWDASGVSLSYLDIENKNVFMNEIRIAGSDMEPGTESCCERVKPPSPTDSPSNIHQLLQR